MHKKENTADNEPNFKSETDFRSKTDLEKSRHNLKNCDTFCEIVTNLRNQDTF